MTDLLFDPAWYLPAGLLAAGAILFWTGNRKLDRTLKNLGGILALLAITWGIVSYLVQTPKEHALTQTRAILSAYKSHNWPRMQELLDPGTTLGHYGNRDMIMLAARQSIDNPGVKDVYILSTDADQVQSHISVTTTLATTVDRAMGRPVRSTWQFDFVNMGGDWTLTTITPLSFEGQSPDPILRELPHTGK
ncbi:MAG TPA: hypothetical protein VFE58_16755 [Tepidisphaeraceae bacterium]|jgi:hypothetical protein|nr:hypothetical protein [Tepidisphaeraceae bacterium]